MTIPGSANPLLLKAPAGGGGGEYTIERSVRFNSSDSAYLSRTPASAGNRKTWTWAGWVKPTKLGTYRGILEGYTGTPAFANRTSILLGNLDQIDVLFDNGSSGRITTTAVFRDPSAWYHIVFACDTTQATASNRFKLYVNGGQVTVFSTASYPAQNYDTGINTTQPYYMGRVVDPLYADFYLADCFLIDGQALDPTSFGEFDANGIWQPIAYTGTYPGNSFHLPFSDNSSAAALGTDTSGNGNDWTVNNLSVLSGGPTSVASASGALPIYNTTDTYGTTKGTGTRTDDNSSSISIALPMQGANNSTTFTDESASIRGSGSSFTVTANSGAKITTSKSKYYGSSGLFDSSSGSYLSWTGSSAIQFGTGDFTIEFFAYFENSQTTNPGLFTYGGHGGSSALAILFSGTTFPGNMRVDWNGTFNQLVTTGTKVVSGAWQHHALVRSGSTAYYYIDGVLAGSASNSVNFQQPATNTATISERVGLIPGYAFNGGIQDFRIYKGVAKYTGNFNPPRATQDATIATGNDSLVDVPQNGTETDTGVGGEVRGNYCTWNPLDLKGTTLSNGNLQAAGSDSFGAVTGTIAVSSGKWYWEITAGSAYDMPGIWSTSSNATSYPGAVSGSHAWYGLGGLYGTGAAGSWPGTFTTNDVIGVALDCDAGTLAYYKNGTSLGTAFTGLSGAYRPAARAGHASGPSSATYINAGQRPFAYTAPSGFKALNTASLPAPIVTKPSEYMDVKLYTGNGSTQTISGLDFSPDLVWIKGRSVAYNPRVFDTVRGTGGLLYTNTTDAETAQPNVNDTFSSFNSDGFSLGVGVGINQSSGTYVAWTWDAGSSTVTNTDGSITSQVRANPSAGFSVVSYSGTISGSAPSPLPTVGHGLGIAPQLVISKSRNNASFESGNWFVWHASAGTGNWLRLNTTGAVSNISGSGGGTMVAPTSTVFSTPYISGSNISGNNYVAYCFAPVEGYSAFGSYTGNGSADGTFVYTGFRPSWVMIKSSTATGNWTINDAARDTYNVTQNRLWANLTSVEGAASNYYIDFLSNGFKIKTDAADTNSSGATYIYASFAEQPFSLARAR